MQTIAHFFGGPQDGVTFAVQGEPPEINFPELAVVRFVPDELPLPDEVPYRTRVYRKRGPALGGHAYYDDQGSR